LLQKGNLAHFSTREKTGVVVFFLAVLFVEESEVEVLLGVKISKNLTWTKQVDELRLELSRRVGIIRRLSHQMPRHTMMKVLPLVFT
jgi:hypothetical protein